MGDLLIQKTVPAEECERFANALTGRECRCDPSKLYTISVRAHGVAEQHQGEPVAWLWEHVNGLRICTTSERAPFTNEHAIPPNCKKTPLYTHTDPGEVEQLRAENEQLREVIKHSDAQIMRQSMRISNQRAKLAERDALLRDVQAAMREYEQGCDQFPPFHHNQLMERIDAALSASAEPSAPKPMLFEEPDNYPDPVEPSALRGWVCDEPGTPGEWSKSKIKPVAPVGDGMHDDTEAVRAAMERKQ